MATLEEIRGGRPEGGIGLLQVQEDEALAKELQQRLADIGLLDPPADGDFGPVSQWAWRAFCGLHGADHRVITAELARRLLANEAPFPLVADGDDLASRVVRTMQSSGYWIARHPDCINIAYVEGHDPDGRRNGNEIDAYNDVRLTFRVRDGRAIELGSWRATTQAGMHWILNPDEENILDPVKFTPQIALGQFKAWSVGTHNASHRALVQRAPIKVHRDRNQDGTREGDPVFEKAGYGINQHHGSNSKRVGRYSAGCLVASGIKGHEEFMRIVQRDSRYQASHTYRFMTAVIGQDQLQD